MIQDSGFCKAVILGIKNCFDFKGRASRAEYWYWGLFILILDQLLASTGDHTTRSVFLLIFFIPNISIAIRRLHDVNFRGWWLLPFVNIVALVVFFLAGNSESNRFGNPPDAIKITVFDKVFFVAGIVLLLTILVLEIITHMSYAV